ncbi:hypothetical protein ACFQ5M_05620 [Agrilactobacillus yilanensis]|uniref:Uncharacterized protein n=1 Tax=Agrilactobacillus yilanensis TaxID=2485997 RepID=A0ABW4J6K9_9LACO|nr:hypothetical protein [Agrilactobacillus yilanensis]
MGLVARRNVDLNGLLDSFASVPDLEKDKKQKKETAKAEDKKKSTKKADKKD